jgi:hypothetical protein
VAASDALRPGAAAVARLLLLLVPVEVVSLTARALLPLLVLLLLLPKGLGFEASAEEVRGPKAASTPAVLIWPLRSCDHSVLTSWAQGAGSTSTCCMKQGLLVVSSTRIWSTPLGSAGKATLQTAQHDK